MATVYLASDLRHDRPVALKVLHPHWRHARPRAVPAGDQAGRAAAAPAHPHRARLGDAGGHLWFTMPYVEGRASATRLNREKQLSVEDAVRIAREAAQGCSTRISTA